LLQALHALPQGRRRLGALGGHGSILSDLQAAKNVGHRFADEGLEVPVFDVLGLDCRPVDGDIQLGDAILRFPQVAHGHECLVIDAGRDRPQLALGALGEDTDEDGDQRKAEAGNQYLEANGHACEPRSRCGRQFTATVSTILG
jgi:hypothetical protein